MSWVLAPLPQDSTQWPALPRSSSPRSRTNRPSRRTQQRRLPAASEPSSPAASSLVTPRSLSFLTPPQPCVDPIRRSSTSSCIVLHSRCIPQLARSNSASQLGMIAGHARPLRSHQPRFPSAGSSLIPSYRPLPHVPLLFLARLMPLVTAACHFAHPALPTPRRPGICQPRSSARQGPHTAARSTHFYPVSSLKPSPYPLSLLAFPASIDQVSDDVDLRPHTGKRIFSHFLLIDCISSPPPRLTRSFGGLDSSFLVIAVQANDSPHFAVTPLLYVPDTIAVGRAGGVRDARQRKARL
ncbi:hypothetical protein DFH08DRAFT_975947 [Mycena albidolilacea]|uniref:Uncharacterized protein n=1 Tax=Mycena albidolilacea TaxID=1033008 RepID=A0AAD6Z450_9AGAR|nr:hypothetical protein DFH08DRAFT_975947 [Mycena albidolilacea]